jgi:hypothetical protein
VLGGRQGRHRVQGCGTGQAGWAHLSFSQQGRHRVQVCGQQAAGDMHISHMLLVHGASRIKAGRCKRQVARE